MRRLLQSDQLEQNFNRDGFVTIDLLNEHEIIDLKALIKALNSDHIQDSTEEKSSYKLSFFNTDLDFKKKVFSEVSSFFQSKVDKWLDNYVPLIINIFDKEPGKGEVPIHQNWTFVDEDKYTSVSVWIPLVNVSRKNGTLEVVKGSHKVLCKYRSPSLPWVFDELNEVLKKKYLVPFELSVGQAAIIDDGILHWSSENEAQEVRTAVQLIMVPKDAEVIHFQAVEGKNTVNIYKVDPQFFMQYNMKDIPNGYQIIGQKELTLKKFNENEFREIVAQNNPEILSIA